MIKWFILSFFTLIAQAHFLTFIPTTDVVSTKSEANVHFDLMFMHPFEQTGMPLELPQGVYVHTIQKPLPLKESVKFNAKAWETHFFIQKPGVYTFFAQPNAYFEKDEAKFISHVPKVIISAYGVEEGWDKPIGLPYEIVPLVKPFGIYQGNIFQGKVLHHGKAAAGIEVEVELFNEFKLVAPTSAHITQVIKTDDNGIFSFVMPHKGWWGFAALIEEGTKTLDTVSYPVENGALLWIKAY